MSRQIEQWPDHTALAWVAADEGDNLPRLLECLLAALDLSPHTVKRRVANILDKPALQSRGQAANWFCRHG